ncbi:MAG: DUF1844 domain-containing protein [Chthonomonas sp.]|nr:DUF1844 domain-containing protein [Chthonomonas sp.]
MSNTPTEPIDVHSLLMIMLEQVSQVAWSKLGLQPDPLTGQMQNDLEQAKVAVDVVSDLAKHLEAKLDDEDKRQIRNLVRDLQVNYIERANGASR